MLLGMARQASAAQLEKLCRGYRAVRESGEAPDPEERSIRRRQLPGGKVKLELVVEADEAELILKAVDRAREVRAEQERQGAAAADVSSETPWPSQADGMVRLAESFLGEMRLRRRAENPVAGNGGERFQVVVHLDQEALGPDGALGGSLEDGSRVSAEALRRVACDCGLVAVRRDGQGLDIGRKSRSIPPAIRRALRLRDRGCAFPGCTHTRFVHAHHVEHWLHGGSTSLENLVQLCSFHHHLVHEGGWTVSADGEGVFSFYPPMGGVVAHVPRSEAVGDAVGWLRGWVADSGLEIDSGTNFPRGDGSPLDCRIAVEALLDTG
jgi:hypothetical protein